MKRTSAQRGLGNPNIPDDTAGIEMDLQDRSLAIDKQL